MTLKSAYFTRSSTATVSVVCSLELQYAVSTSNDQSLSWSSCPGPSNSTSVTVSLIEGMNTIRLRVRISDTENSYNVSSLSVYSGDRIELVDPTPYVGDRWGDSSETPYTYLPNGYIAVSDSNDDFAGIDAGAVHIFSKFGELLYTFTGDTAGDHFGNGGFSIIDNSILAIHSPNDVVNGNSNAGSIRFINIEMGNEIFRVTGDHASDQLGTELAFGMGSDRIVIPNELENTATLSSVGAVRIYSTSGDHITTIQGDEASDRLGSAQVEAAGDSRLIITSPLDDNSGIVNAGSFHLVDVTNGNILSTIRGDDVSDQIGLTNATTLANGNIVLQSREDDVGGVVDAGSVYLLSSNGAVIQTFSGTNTGSMWGYYPQVKDNDLSHFLLLAPYDDNNSFTDNGLLMVIDGNDGTILNTITGESNSDLLANDDKGGELANGNFAIRSQNYNFSGISNTGMIMILDGTTGALIQRHGGDNLGGRWGQFPMRVNANSMFLVRAQLDDSDGFTDNGACLLFNGTTGDLVQRIKGIQDDERLCTNVPQTVSGEHFFINSNRYDNGATLNVGRGLLIDGDTGALLATFTGTLASDQFASGSSLGGDNFLVKAPNADRGGVVDAGYLALVSQSGSIIQEWSGTTTSESLTGALSLSDSRALIYSPNRDGTNGTASGVAQLINTTTGETIFSWQGNSASEMLGTETPLASSDGMSVLVAGSPSASRYGLTDTGVLTLIPVLD